MELAKSYLNPTDPQENNCCSELGQLPPKLSFKDRKLASHRRSKSEQQSNAFPLLDSDKRVRNSPSRLSKTLPEVPVKNCIPRPHCASNSLPDLKDHHLVGSRPALRSRKGFRESVNIATNADLSRIYIEGGQWWELSPCKYRVKPTNFERRRFYFKDSKTFDQLQRMEGSSNSLSVHHYISTSIPNTHSMHVADNVKHDDLNRDEDLYLSNSCRVAALSKDCERKFILRDKEAQNPPSKKGPSLSHAKQSSSLKTVWNYSRSKSGIRKLIHSPPSVNHVFAVDFNPLASNDRHHLTDTVATKNLTHSNIVDVSGFQKPDVQPQAITEKESLRDKTQSMRLPVPKIYIDGTALNEATPLTGSNVKGEQLFQKEVHLLAVTCEWIKLFEGSQNIVPQAVPSSSGYLSAIDSSRFFQQSKNHTDNHTKNDTSTNHNVSSSQSVLGTFNRMETNAHSNFQRGDSYLSDSQFAAQVNQQFPGGPMSNTPSVMKGPSRSLFKAKQTEPSEKPPNLFPDVVIFGRHLQSLCESSLLAGQEEERMKLREVAQSALNGQLSKEHVTALHTIYEQFHSKLLTPLPPSPVSYDITNGSQDCVTNSSVHVSFNLDSTCVTSDVANENEDDDGVQQFSSEKQQDHKPTTTNPKAPPKLNRRQQQARSDAENIILLSVREDLKYFKESMSMSIPSKNKPRKSLLPPLKSNTIAKGKKRRSDVSTKRSKKKVVHSVDESSVVSANPTFGCSNTNLDVPNSMDSESVTSSNDADKSTDNTQITLQTTSPQHLSTSTAAPAKTNFNTKAVFDSKRRHSFLSPRPNQEPDHKQSAAFSTRRSSVPAGQLSRRSSLFRSGLKSKMLSNGRLPTPDRPQFAVSLMNEIGDIKSLVQTIIGTDNPHSMSNTARGSDIVTDTEQRSQLNMREKDSRGESRQLATLEEQEQDKLEDGGEEKEIENEEEEKERLRKIQEELDNEEKVRRARERLAEERKEEERKERLRRIHEELEQGLNSEEKVRRARKRLAEAHRRDERYERERQRFLQKKQAQEMRRLAMEKERHTALLDKLKLEANIRHCILEEHNKITNTWNDVDYSCISYHLGQECCQNLRRQEDEKSLRQKQEMEKLILEACEFQHRELLRKLEEAQRVSMDGLERDELNHLLNLSRASVYSYFENVSDQVYHVPEELLTD